MTVYINGIVLLVGQPTPITRADGTAVLDKLGVQMYTQSVTMQHEFQTQNGMGYNRYVTFEINANSTNKLISKLNFQPNEELEVALNIDSQATQEGRWYNIIRCFAAERDKSKWHRPVVQRVAVMPPSNQGPAQAPAFNPAPAPSYGPAPAASVPPPADPNDDLPF